MEADERKDVCPEKGEWAGGGGRPTPGGARGGPWLVASIFTAREEASSWTESQTLGRSEGCGEVEEASSGSGETHQDNTVGLPAAGRAHGASTMLTSAGSKPARVSVSGVPPQGCRAAAETEPAGCASGNMQGGERE